MGMPSTADRWTAGRVRALLGALLGATLLLAACRTALGPSDLAGTWGGVHAEVTFDSLGTGSIQYDCAHGRIDAPITLSAAGALHAVGVHVQEHGGPVRDGEIPDTHPAEYAGNVQGDRLTYTVTLTDGGTMLGPYTVRRGQPAQLFRCL